MPQTSPTSATHCRVLIVDCQPAAREGLAYAIESVDNVRVSGQAGDAKEALDLIARETPDVIVADLELGQDGGLDLIRRARLQCPEANVLVWSMREDPAVVERAFRAGALGYIHKSRKTRQVVEAIQTLYRGEFYLCPEISRRILQRSLGGQNDPSAAPEALLSTRELEVFQLIGEGYRTAAIARRLNISPHTVETHRQRIKSKLQVRCTTRLTSLACRWLLEQQSA